MKKVISTLAAAMMAATTFSAFSVLAVESVEVDELSISTETLAESITVDDVVIPAGSTAVTVNISNNSGFEVSTTQIELGDAYEVITDSDDMVSITRGAVMGESIICALESDNVITVASASAYNNETDGAMFTFYVNKNAASDDTDISFVEVEEVSVAVPASINSYYVIGDVDNDGAIDADDSSIVLHAISKNNGEKISVEIANKNLERFFYSPPVCKHAELADTDKSNFIAKADADDILLHYTCAMSGQNYNAKSDGHCGEVIWFND